VGNRNGEEGARLDTPAEIASSLPPGASSRTDFPGSRILRPRSRSRSRRRAVRVAAHAHGLGLARHFHLGAALAAELAVGSLDPSFLAPAALVLAFHGRTSPPVESQQGCQSLELGVSRRSRPSHASPAGFIARAPWVTTTTGGGGFGCGAKTFSGSARRTPSSARIPACPANRTDALRRPAATGSPSARGRPSGRGRGSSRAAGPSGASGRPATHPGFGARPTRRLETVSTEERLRRSEPRRRRRRPLPRRRASSSWPPRVLG